QAQAALIDVRAGNEAVPTRVVEGWHTATVKGEGVKRLTARFRLAIDRTRGQPQVVLHPDRVPMARVEITVPGKREVVFEPAVPRQTTVKGEGERATTSAVAHLPPTDELTLRWTEARATPESQVRVIVQSYQLLTLKEGFLKGTVHLDYEISNGELKELPIKLPAGVDVYRVTGPGVEDWQVLPATDDAPRQVRVVLGEATEGKVDLKVELERTVETEKEGTALELPVLSAIKASRQEGVVALFDGDKTGFAPAQDPQGRFRKVGEDALPVAIRQTLRNKVNQAWKFINEDGPLTSAVATAQAREVRFDARVDTLYNLREGSLTGNATVLIEIKSGRRDTLHVSLPSGVAEPRISGPSLSKTEPAPDFAAGEGRTAYIVRFTQALEGAIQLDVEFEQLLKKDENALTLPDLRVHGAEVESGHFGLAAETGMEAVVGEAKDLRPVEVEELPKAVRLRSDTDLSFGYGYARAPWSLAITLKRNRTIETLAAVATHVWLETNVLDNGHVVTRATYQVQNDGRQDVRLVLPEGAEVLSVAVDGSKVKAVSDEQTGALAVPIPKNRTAPIQVTYEVVRDKLGGVGALDLQAPKADVRASDIQWLVRYPARLALLKTDTDLRPGEAFEWRAPDAEADAAIELPVQADMRSALFTYSVQEPTAKDGKALSVGVWYTSGGTAFEPLVFGLALLLLALVTWRRGGTPGGMTGSLWIMLGAAVGLLALKASIWRLTEGEASLAIVAVVAVGVVAWRKRRAARKAAEQGASDEDA
ncbi:MAG: hypothetical protein KC613_26430, partial [Myxococcales bacterium]|nr:hypothetical protein [Myxococcales bacterium]